MHSIDWIYFTVTFYSFYFITFFVIVELFVCLYIHSTDEIQEIKKNAFYCFVFIVPTFITQYAKFDQTYIKMKRLLFLFYPLRMNYCWNRSTPCSSFTIQLFIFLYIYWSAIHPISSFHYLLLSIYFNFLQLQHWVSETKIIYLFIFSFINGLINMNFAWFLALSKLICSHKINFNSGLIKIEPEREKISTSIHVNCQFNIAINHVEYYVWMMMWDTVFCYYRICDILPDICNEFIRITYPT